MTTVRIGGADFGLREIGSPLPVVRFALGSGCVFAGPYRSAEEHEKHLLDTFGSGNWPEEGEDEVRFSMENSGLAGLWLRVPEVPVDDSADVRIWHDRTLLSGCLVASAAPRFTLPRVTTRWYEAESGILACFTDDAHVHSEGERTALEVTDCLELLFREGVFVGWLLRAPETFLVESWQYPLSRERDVRLAYWLGEYFCLVQRPTVEAVEDGAREPLHAMHELAERIDVGTDPYGRRRVLRDALRDVAEWLED